MKNHLPLRIITAVALALGLSHSANAQSHNRYGGFFVPGSAASVKGNLSVGSAYSSLAAPAGGAIFQGNVGIGANAGGNSLLVYNSDIPVAYLQGNAGTSLVLKNDSATTSNCQIYFTAPSFGNDFIINSDYNGNHAGDLGFYNVRTSSYPLVIQAGSGYVGIGGTPAFPLHVQNSSTTAGAMVEGNNAELHLQSDNPSVTRTAVYFGGPNPGFQIGNDLFLNGQNSFYFYDNTAGLRMLITATGELGIGTTTPRAMVDIPNVYGANSAPINSPGGRYSSFAPLSYLSRYGP